MSNPAIIDVEYEQPACPTKHAWARVPVEPGPKQRAELKERIRGAGKAQVNSNHKLRQGNSGASQVTYAEESDYKIYQTRIGSTANKVNLAFEEALPELKKGLVNSISGLF
jgi:hypothetical protein